MNNETLSPERLELVELLLKQKGITVPSARMIPRRCEAEAEPYGLSFAQERLWFLDQFEPGNSAYNLFAAVELTGRLDVAAIERSVSEVVRRHKSLRTTFVSVNGRPMQVINPAANLRLPVTDLSHLSETARESETRRLVDEEARRPFDLASGPLLRVSLLRLGDEQHVTLVTIHHIVSDGWSMGILMREVATLYQGFTVGEPSLLAPLPIQYVDFARWQREWLQGEGLKTQLDYWRRQLAGAPPVLELPADRPRPEVRTHCGAARSFVLPTDLSESLRALSRREGVTLFILLLAAFKTLLFRSTGQEDIVVGADIANRKRVETEALIGFFINMLVLRTDLSRDPPFRELLRRVREVAVGAYAHQDVPFEKLVEELQPERSLNVSPLFQVVFNFQADREKELRLPGLKLRMLPTAVERVQFDLSLFIEERQGELYGSWRYSTDLFEAASIERLHGHYETLLRSIVAQPEARLRTLEIYTEEEKKQQQAASRERKAANFQKFMGARGPKAQSLSPQRLIKTAHLDNGESLPLVVKPEVEELDLLGWAGSHLQLIESQLSKYGAILFRDFKISSAIEFRQFTESVTTELLEYHEPSSPRTEVNNKIYTSTDYPADQWINLHNELSYGHYWPRKIFFFCLTPAEQGGETPIASSRRVFDLLDPKLRERFVQKKVMYVRNFGEGLGLTWQHVFQTKDRAAVNEYCRRAHIEIEWKEGDRLKTSQVRQAVITHPQTGETLWFNQAHLFHVSSLPPAVHQSLRQLFKEEDLPNNAYYGDGSPIECSVIEEINEAYRQAAVTFTWQKGDVLMLDNMRVAHGRKPFAGTRQILVAMAESFSNHDGL